LEEAVETEVFHSQTFKQTIQNSFLFRVQKRLLCTRYDFLIGFGVRKAASRTRYGNSSYFPEPCHSAHNIKGRAYNTESDRKGNNVIDKQITAKRQSHIIA
jgi:hypothetical protein